MATMTWIVAPSGYLQPRELGALPLIDGGCGRSVSAEVLGGASGLPVAGVPMRTAAPFGASVIAPVTTTDVRFNGTPLGIPSSRRPSS